MEGIWGTRARRDQLDRLMDERRLELRIKWVQVARRAQMSPQHLVRIRKGRVAISWDAAAGIESALQWEPGSIEAAVLHGVRPTPLSATHAQLSPLGEANHLPPGWTSEEEAGYKEQYPKWNPLLQTQEMQFTRQAYRTMRDEFRKRRALEQFTQGARSNEDGDVSPDRGIDT